MAAIHRQPLSKVFRFVPLAVFAVGIAGVHGALAAQAGGGFNPIGVPLLISEAMLLGVWLVALTLAYFGSRGAATELATARTLAAAAEKASAAHVAKLNAEFEQEHHQQGQDLSATFHDTSLESQAEMRQGQQELDAKLARLPARLERLHQRRLAKLAVSHQTALQLAQRETDAIAEQRQQAHAQAVAAIEAETTAGISVLAEPWQR